MRKVSGIYYFLLASCAGVVVYFPLRNQDLHAAPTAIAIACVVASIASGGVGWLLGHAYVLPRGRVPAFVWAPLVVFLCTSLVAAVTYYATIPIFNSYALETLLALPGAATDVAEYTYTFAVLSSPVWLIGLPVCSYLLHSRASAHGI